MAQTKRPDEALRELAPFLGDDSMDCDALEIAGWAHAVKEDFPGAVTLLRKAVSACSERTSTVLTLATVYAIMGNTPEAETLLGQVITRDPGNRKAVFLLAEIQKRYGEETDPYFAAARLWVDGIIDPIETRSVVSMGIAMADRNADLRPFNPGVIQT